MCCTVYILLIHGNFNWCDYALKEIDLLILLYPRKWSLGGYIGFTLSVRLSVCRLSSVDGVILLRTPPTVLIGECWNFIGMFFVTIRKNVMRRNFEFLPSRSDTPTPNPFRTFANSFYNFHRRVLKFHTDVLWDHTQKRNAAEFWNFAQEFSYPHPPTHGRLTYFCELRLQFW